MKAVGLDHADIRVSSLAAAEPFYDALLPAIGLVRKTYSHVDADGEWHDVDAEHPCNAAEYHTPIEPGTPGWFVGFIEDTRMTPTATRIAFAVDVTTNLSEIEPLVRTAGGRNVESSTDDYPAVFFEDPCGTRLEICRRRRQA